MHDFQDYRAMHDFQDFRAMYDFQDFRAMYDCQDLRTMFDFQDFLLLGLAPLLVLVLLISRTIAHSHCSTFRLFVLGLHFRANAGCQAY